jgi:hypothetical protein
MTPVASRDGRANRETRIPPTDGDGQMPKRACEGQERGGMIEIEAMKLVRRFRALATDATGSVTIHFGKGRKVTRVRWETFEEPEVEAAREIVDTPAKSA